MRILGIEKLSLVDWPDKLCATIFTGGCDFCCPFCHNADIVFNSYDPLSETEVLGYLSKRRKVLDGVTISGGEPTLWPDLIDFIKKVKELGLAVKLDTNGSRPEELKMLLDSGLVDYVAMDIKNDFDHYSDICGVTNSPAENVKKSLEILHKCGVSYELRTTILKPYHNKQNIELLSKQLSGEKTLYLQKFVDSGNLIKANGLSAVPLDEAKEFQKILKTTIENVTLRGY